MENASDDLQVAFRLPPDSVSELIDTLQAEGLHGSAPTHAAGATGGGDLVTIIVPVAIALFGAITKIIVEWDRSRRATVEVEGAKVTNLSPETAEKLLKDYLAAKRRARSRANK